MQAARPGLSLVEVLIGVAIIVLSALPILELIRSGTASLEVTEVEAAARQLADLGGFRVPRPVREPAAGPR